MLKIGKKQVKIVSLVIVAVFVLGVVGIAATQMGTGYAASAGTSSNIGVVDNANNKLVTQHPDFANAQATMRTEIETAQKDFESKSATMNDQEKQQYLTQLQQRLGLKEQEIFGPIIEKVNAAIKSVADAKGLAVVLDKSNVIYGGQDITADVVKKLGGK